MTVQLQTTGEALERLLHRGVAQIEKEADLRRLLLEGNKGQLTFLSTNSLRPSIS